MTQAAGNGDYLAATGYLLAGTGFGLMNVATLGGGAAITSTVRGLGTELVAGQGGRFGSLLGTVGDKLTAHHMPQAALKFTSRADGGAVVLTAEEHALTRTFGFKGALTKAEDAASKFRDVLAKDIRDLRTIVGNKYNEGVKDMLRYYKENFPELMKKE